jgi:hypothetical protein
MPTSRNSTKTPGVRGRCREDFIEDLVRSTCAPSLRQFALFDSPTKINLSSAAQGVSEEKMVQMIAAHKERQARHTTKLYGPSHPQSWERNYSPEAKLLAQLGIRR